MAINTNSLGWTEKRFHSFLVNEAARDVVFLMEIAHQLKYGFGCADINLPIHMENAVRELLDNSAVVGFGEPGTPSWNPQVEFLGASSDVAARIVGLWRTDPEHYKFLVFVRECQSAA